jgi:hypothetical protein
VRALLLHSYYRPAKGPVREHMQNIKKEAMYAKDDLKAAGQATANKAVEIKDTVKEKAGETKEKVKGPARAAVSSSLLLCAAIH